MIYAKELLTTLHQMQGIKTHLIISSGAKKIMELELDDESETISCLADQHYQEDDLEAPFASGSFIHQGMVVCPCSMATLAAISHGLGNNLIHRAADVTLKEKRALVLVTRETPLSQIHLQNMLLAARAGAVILPACPGFYHSPRTIEDLALQLVSRILDQLKIENNLFARWTGRPLDPKDQP